MSTFKCYKDICERGAQYCEDARERCYWCKDASDRCWTTDMPRQCNQFCDDVRQQLMKQSYSRGYSDAVSSHNGPDYPFIISTSTAVVFALILLGLGIYKLKKKLKISLDGRSRYSVPDQESPETNPLTPTGGDEGIDIDIREPMDEASSTNTTGRRSSVDSGLDNRDSINSSHVMSCACNREGAAPPGVCIRCAGLKQLPPRNDVDSLKATILCG